MLKKTWPWYLLIVLALLTVVGQATLQIHAANVLRSQAYASCLTTTRNVAQGNRKWEVVRKQMLASAAGLEATHPHLSDVYRANAQLIEDNQAVAPTCHPS